MATLEERKELAAKKLEQYGQTHVLKYYDTLTEEEKDKLLTQIEQTDLSVTKYVHHREELPGRGEITPLKALEISEIQKREKEYHTIGLEQIRAGKVAAVLLAGGMGTRLGSDNPKCMYDIGLTHPVYIMQRLVENMMDAVHEAGRFFPFFIMTSDKNHDATVSFMKEHSYFGYDPEMVFFFRQDMAPATDYEGKIYMENRFRMASSPNGNGGWFSSMNKAGLLDKLHELGVEWLNCFAVDNVLQRIADPSFIGATIAENCVSGAKVVRKAAPDEKVGAMCLEDGKPSIVEYYEMTPELLGARDDNGNPSYNFGVILNYLFREDKLEEIMNHKLMLHIVEKKIPYMDAEGSFVKPESPNGYKFEELILDMVHEMESCLPYEVERSHEFAPIKNKTGVDSVESARKLCAENGIKL